MVHVGFAGRAKRIAITKVPKPVGGTGRIVCKVHRQGCRPAGRGAGERGQRRVVAHQLNLRALNDGTATRVHIPGHIHIERSASDMDIGEGDKVDPFRQRIRCMRCLRRAVRLIAIG